MEVLPIPLVALAVAAILFLVAISAGPITYREVLKMHVAVGGELTHSQKKDIKLICGGLAVSFIILMVSVLFAGWLFG